MTATEVIAPRSPAIEERRPRQIAIVAGTRPEIIKLAPLMDAIDARVGAGSAFVIDTGQHHDPSLSANIWADVGRAPHLSLQAGGRTRAGGVAYVLGCLGELWATDAPDAVVVQGDTSSTLAGALAANATGTPLVHVEAGLRSGDRRMPEEHNRIVVDQLADLCCAPTTANARNLLSSGIDAARIAITGNTIVEAVRRNLPSSGSRLRVLAGLGLMPGRFALATLHRPENADDPHQLGAVLDALDRLTRRLPVILPLHPRTRAALHESGAYDRLGNITVTGPLGARDFLALAAEAAVIVSDSGGVVEEATVLKRPVVVVRRSTERREAMTAGFARLVEADGLEAAANRFVDEPPDFIGVPSPFGDGHASGRIADLVASLLARVEHADV